MERARCAAAAWARWASGRVSLRALRGMPSRNACPRCGQQRTPPVGANRSAWWDALRPQARGRRPRAQNTTLRGNPMGRAPRHGARAGRGSAAAAAAAAGAARSDSGTRSAAATWSSTVRAAAAAAASGLPAAEATVAVAKICGEAACAARPVGGAHGAGVAPDAAPGAAAGPPVGSSTRLGRARRATIAACTASGRRTAAVADAAAARTGVECRCHRRRNDLGEVAAAAKADAAAPSTLAAAAAAAASTAATTMATEASATAACAAAAPHGLRRRRVVGRQKMGGAGDAQEGPGVAALAACAAVPRGFPPAARGAEREARGDAAAKPAQASARGGATASRAGDGPRARGAQRRRVGAAEDEGGRRPVAHVGPSPAKSRRPPEAAEDAKPQTGTHTVAPAPRPPCAD